MKKENDTIQNSNEGQYPSIPLAYDIALKYYDWIINRKDAVDGRIDKLLTWISSINIGIIAIVHTNDSTNFESCYFIIAMFIFFFIIVLGIFTKFFHRLNLIDLENLYNEHMAKKDWEFKKDFIYNTVYNNKNNTKTVNQIGLISKLLLILFVSEIFFLLMWFIH